MSKQARRRFTPERKEQSVARLSAPGATQSDGGWRLPRLDAAPNPLGRDGSDWWRVPMGRSVAQKQSVRDRLRVAPPDEALMRS